jgi:hypothetical protein
MAGEIQVRRPEFGAVDAPGQVARFRAQCLIRATFPTVAALDVAHLAMNWLVGKRQLH